MEVHKGEISFPGGLCKKDDGGPGKTALREAFEEIGIRPQDVKVLGMLDNMKTMSTHYRIIPVIGVIPYPYSFIINKVEVDEIIEIPLNHLLDEGNEGKESITKEGITYTGYTYYYKHYLIWAATARILKNFSDIMINLKDFHHTYSYQS